MPSTALLSVVWVYLAILVAGEPLQPLCPPLAQGLSTIDAGSCLWSAPAATGSNKDIGIVGGRSSLAASATPAIFAGEALPGRRRTSADSSAGLSLAVERLVLVGFDYAAPGSTAPPLWPAGLLDADGASLSLTDVRLVTSNQQLFSAWLHFFASDTESGVAIWTDNATVLYVHQWKDTRTQLAAVALLLQAPAQAPNSLNLPSPLVKNSLVAGTNRTLLPFLLMNAAITTPQPLLVFITTNVSLGAHPPLPVTGIAINRPVVFIGLQSLVTSIDFEMVVNQLNATSKYSNITVVGLVLENLAPGDAETSAVASPFSIAISNNLWAAFYNRSVPNDARLALLNCTMVLPQESEMAYVTYMFTMYTSSLPYLRQQTSFYTDVLHLSMLQFSPGPGNRAITVIRLKSWYHWWRNVVFTTDPVVAAPMPLPPRQLVLQTTTRTSPLVQAVHSADSLKASAEMVVVGDRAHILLLLSNISMAGSSIAGSSPGNGSAADPIRLKSLTSWMGSSPADRAVDASPKQQGKLATAGAMVSVGFDYLTNAVLIPDGSPKDALQLQQLVLWQLPQGPGVASALGKGDSHIPPELWTMLLWSIKRPLQDKTLSLDGVILQLPQPELEYIIAAAKQSSDFVVELAGNAGNALTFQGVSAVGDGVHVGAFQGPGIVASNLTLTLDPAAATSMAAAGGYIWPDPSHLPQPIPKSTLAPWVIAVITLAVVLAAILAVLGGYVLYRSRRVAWCRAPSNNLLLDSPSSKHSRGSGSGNSFPRRIDESGVSGSAGSQRISAVAPSGVKCVDTCEACMSLGSNSHSLQDSTADMAHGHNKAARQVVLEPGAIAAVQQSQRLAKQRQSSDAGSTSEQQQSSGQVELAHSNMDVAALKDAPVPVHVADTLADSVAAGMQRWRAAVSSTTMLLMERRMDAANMPMMGSGSGSTPSVTRQPSAGSSAAIPDRSALGTEQRPGASQVPCPDPAAVCAQWGGTPPQLQLLELLGQGSCGAVYLATWRGKRVAVKVMHLPANALLGPQGIALAAVAGGSQKPTGNEDPDSLRQQRRARVMQQNSPPHMAIMEAVLSTTMSHPNVVQVYTYMLNPLTRSDVAQAGFSNQGGNSTAFWPQGQDIAGWELKLVMEYCDEGSLRDALDCGMLTKPGSFLAPSAVLTLAHDVAAAMMHLHSEGIVHADLKAANVMLTNTGEDLGGVWAVGPGGRRLTAKVADFGLALPLDPSDTHATLSARGTPTHMSPELFMSGHVSKAGDVYAYGILLYEIMTGMRAYAGVPTPLLPHEVARQGLRPTWPPNMPPGCRDFRKLAEACWAQQPQDRPTFADIMRVLDGWAAGGHGYPIVSPVAPPMGVQLQQQLHVKLQSFQQPQLLQQQQVNLAAAAAAAPQHRQIQVQVQVQPMEPPSLQQQQQWPQEEDEEQPPSSPASTVPPGLCSPATASPQGSGAVASSAASGRQQHAGRKLHMDWSEVDFTGA